MFAPLLALLAAGALNAQPDRFGLPSCSGPGQELITKAAFIVCHASDTRTPVWTAYELTPSRLAAAPARRARFRRDRSLAQGGASDSDYRNSGFTRGHMVPARDVAWSEAALQDSFLLSNAVPQNAIMNRSIWRRLENEVRRRAESADSVVVFTGPVFCPDSPRIGPGGVAVPCALYKVVAETRVDHTETFTVMVPNEGVAAGPIDTFVTSLSHVRERTGLDLLSRLEPGEQ